MSREILVFDKSIDSGEALISDIKRIYRRLSGAVFTVHDPEDVFSGLLPERPKAAFFALDGMYEAEAVRKFHMRYGDAVPIIIVSDSGEYGVWSWRLGTSCYIKRPIETTELLAALNRCALDKPIAASY